MMKKIATAAVVYHENKILIAQRAKDDYWEFPGGRIDEGETPEECLIREYWEELDIGIRITEQWPTVVGQFRGQDMTLYCFKAEWTEGTITRDPLVHHDVKWIDPEELSDYEIIDEDRELVKYILEI